MWAIAASARPVPADGDRPDDPLLFGLFLLLPAALGWIITARAWTALSRARASRAWQTTHGVVTAVSLRRVSGKTPYHEVQVAYDYWVDGDRYSGRRRLFTSWPVFSQPRKQADETAARYAPGTSVTVRYDPSDPGEAVIEPRVDRWEMGLNFGIGLFCLGLVFWGVLALLGFDPF